MKRSSNSTSTNKTKPPTSKRLRNDDASSSSSSSAPKRRRQVNGANQRHVQEVLNAMANAHANKPAATFKNMPRHVLTQIASKLTTPANLARFATVNKKVTGNVAKIALASKKQRANESTAQTYQEIVDFFKPWIKRFRTANDDVVAYMNREPGLTLDQYAHYARSRFNVRLRIPENRGMDGGIFYNVDQKRGKLVAKCVIGKVARDPFTLLRLGLAVSFEPSRGMAHWLYELEFHTSDFKPIVRMTDSEHRPTEMTIQTTHFGNSLLVEQILPTGRHVSVALNNNAHIMKPEFYVNRYSILGEPWWRHLKGDHYARVPPSQAYPMKALCYAIKHLFGGEEAKAYKRAMGVFATKGQFEAQFIIREKMAHRIFQNNRIKSVLQHRDPQILSNADVRALASHQNDAMKNFLGPRLQKNAREGSGNAFRRRVFSGP